MRITVEGGKKLSKMCPFLQETLFSVTKENPTQPEILWILEQYTISWALFTGSNSLSLLFSSLREWFSIAYFATLGWCSICDMEESETYIYKSDHFREQVSLKTNGKHCGHHRNYGQHLSFYDQTEYVHILQLSSLRLVWKFETPPSTLETHPDTFDKHTGCTLWPTLHARETTSINTLKIIKLSTDYSEMPLKIQ